MHVFRGKNIDFVNTAIGFKPPYERLKDSLIQTNVLIINVANIGACKLISYSCSISFNTVIVTLHAHVSRGKLSAF